MSVCPLEVHNTQLCAPQVDLGPLLTRKWSVCLRHWGLKQEHEIIFVKYLPN